MDATNLEGMKRAELQKLAKKAGIKANKKVCKIRESDNFIFVCGWRLFTEVSLFILLLT